MRLPGYSQANCRQLSCFLAILDRIETLDGDVGAFVHLDRERALKAARSAEKEIRAGLWRGPLHGLPVAFKDIFHIKGMPTRAGSRTTDPSPRMVDASLVARLRQRGAILLGKVAANELSCGGPDVYSHPRNPWSLALTPGGSSAGAAAALASHMVPLAVGGDTLGSVRQPAAFCGIAGLRPTYGRVSRSGAFPLAWSLDQPGPMARSVKGVALLYEGISGRDPLDPTTAGQPFIRS